MDSHEFLVFFRYFLDMSQIPRSQFGLKKRSQGSPMVTIPALEIEQNITKAKKSNGSANGNGHKNGSFDNEVVIIEDDMFAVVGHEEVVAAVEDVTAPQVEDPSPTKKKRSRKSKDSTESKDSNISKKTEDGTAKSPVEKKSSLDDVAAAPSAPAPEVAPTEAKEYKIVKLSSNELPLSSLKRRSDRFQNASTIVNLSSVSSTDQSTKIIADETMETPTVERRVSGRRSTRPLDDIKFSYRTPNPNDSLNATIGSEVNVSMLETPGVDRKRRQLSDSVENIDSPKRSRLDLSSLFSSFSSPVTMLRNRFKRTNLESTPIAPLNEFYENEDGTEFNEVDLNEKSEEVVQEKEEEELQVITTPVKKTKSCTIM